MNNSPERDNDTLDTQLATYSRRAARHGRRKPGTAEVIGCTAAAGGLAFAGGDAMGAIQHFTTQLSVAWNAATATGSASVAAWDINNNGNPDGALFGARNGGLIFAGIGVGNIAGGTGNVYFAPDTALAASWAANLPPSQSSWNYVQQNLARFGGAGSTASGGGFLNTTGYAGFAFGDTDLSLPIYGWVKARTDIDFAAGTAKMTIFEWAYDDTGAPIRIADRGVPADVPAPATPLLTLLGLGAMGVTAYRRRREDGLKRLADEQDQAAA